tara:strand:+ start:3926 stop:5065 length:1140 start_codon:yes stop_codon:yes gene_type:complete
MNNKMDLKSKAYEDYMARISKESIPAYEPEIGTEELVLLEDVVKSNWLSEGKYVRKFEEKLRKICAREYALAFNNCTAALITGMKGMGIGAGDDVIVQSMVHSADPNSISAAGANPIFSDIDEKTLCLSAETIDKSKTNKTKAVLYVSLYGNVSDLDSISEYCYQNDLILINDCAPALFGIYKSRPIASYGNFSTLSFFADKTITTGEGGMLLTDDKDLISECNIYKHDGRRERGVDIIERRGFNYRLTELQAAVGVAQISKSDRFIQHKKNNQRLFKTLLKEVNQVRVFDFNSEGIIVPHRNIIFVPDASGLITHLVNNGVGSRTLFMPMHSQPCYNYKIDFPVTEKLFKTGICLPSAPSLEVNDIEYICDLIKKYYS